MARITLLRPMLDVHSIDETIAFWRDKLGFTLLGSWGHDPARPTWCQLERDGVRVMFTKAETEPHEHDDGTVHGHEPALGGALYFDADDVDALHAELSKIVKIEWGPNDYPHGMREFAVLDNNGFMIQFGMPVA